MNTLIKANSQVRAKFVKQPIWTKVRGILSSIKEQIISKIIFACLMFVKEVKYRENAYKVIDVIKEFKSTHTEC